MKPNLFHFEVKRSQFTPDSPALAANRQLRVAAQMIHSCAGELAVYQIGQGSKTIVFWPSLFTDHTMYRAQIAELQQDYRLILIDGPGHGHSGAPTPNATLESHAAAALQVMDALGVAQAAFVGTSWGGLVGTHLAYNHPDRISHLIALNTPFDTKPKHPELADKIIVWTSRVFGASPSYGAGVANAFFSPYSVQHQAQRISDFKNCFPLFKPAALAAVARTVLLERQSTMAMLPKLSMPTLVVAGSDDRNYAPAASRQAAAFIPNAQYVELADCGHLCAVEAADQVSALIRQQLAKSLTTEEQTA